MFRYAAWKVPCRPKRVTLPFSTLVRSFFSRGERFNNYFCSEQHGRDCFPSQLEGWWCRSESYRGVARLSHGQLVEPRGGVPSYGPYPPSRPAQTRASYQARRRRQHRKPYHPVAGEKGGYGRCYAICGRLCYGTSHARRCSCLSHLHSTPRSGTDSLPTAARVLVQALEATIHLSLDCVSALALLFCDIGKIMPV